MATAKKKQIQRAIESPENHMRTSALSPRTALEIAYEKVMRYQTGTPEYERAKEELLDALFISTK